MNVPKKTPEGSGLNAVDSRSVYERVYDEIRAGLAKGAFSEGEALTTRGLAAAFGTSEMPVREALRRLVAEKYIVQLSNRGFQVPRLDRSSFDDIISVRVVLERTATARAAECAKPEQIAALYMINAEIQTAIDAGCAKDVLRLNEEFHFAMYALAGSETLIEMVEMLWSRSGPYLTSVMALPGGSDVFVGAVAMHERILKAIEAKAPLQAADALEEDVSFAVRWYQEHSRKDV